MGFSLLDEIVCLYPLASSLVKEVSDNDILEQAAVIGSADDE
jgi:hypothetical protein